MLGRFIFATLILLLPPSGAPQGPLAVELRIEGVVLEGVERQALANVQVEVQPSNKVVSTDSRGRFTLQLENPGRYYLVPSRSGFVPSRLQFSRDPGTWVQVSRAQSLETVELTMIREGVVTGTVLDTNGQPLPDRVATVSLLRLGYDENGKRRLVAAPLTDSPLGADVVRTDDLGRYRFFGVPPGDYYVRVGGSIGLRPPVYYPGVTDEERATAIHVSAGEELRLGAILSRTQETVGVRLRLGPTDSPATITTVLFSNGEKQVGNFMYLTPSVNGQTVVDLSIAGSQRYSILAQWPAPAGIFYGVAELYVSTTPLESEVHMTRAHRVTGRVVGANGQSVNVNCRLHSDSLFAFKLGPSGCIGGQYSAGSYWLDLDGAPEDAYVLSATASGQDILAAPLRLSDDIELDIRLAPQGGVIEGRVLDVAGKSLSDATVVLIPEEPLRAARLLYKVVVSDVRGRYEIRGIRPGTYQLFAWSQLDGAAFRNSEFMKAHEGKGKPIQIESSARIAIDVIAAK